MSALAKGSDVRVAAPPLPLCKDCIWFKRDLMGIQFSTCHVPQRCPDSLIDGRFKKGTLHFPYPSTGGRL